MEHSQLQWFHTPFHKAPKQNCCQVYNIPHIWCSQRSTSCLQVTMELSARKSLVATMPAKYSDVHARTTALNSWLVLAKRLVCGSTVFSKSKELRADIPMIGCRLDLTTWMLCVGMTAHGMVTVLVNTLRSCNKIAGMILGILFACDLQPEASPPEWQHFLLELSKRVLPSLIDTRMQVPRMAAGIDRLHQKAV